MANSNTIGMHSPTLPIKPDLPFISETLVIALLYAALAKLGFIYAILSTNVTVFWPPSGLALATFMTLGWRAGAGIWLGSFVINAWTLDNMITSQALITSVFIASGSTLQAAAAAWLIGRFTGFGVFCRSRHKAESRESGLFRLALWFVTIPPVSTVIAASIGTASLVLGGFAISSDTMQIWTTWWIGDYAGMISFGPAMRCLAMSFRREDFHNDPVILSLAGLMVGAGVFLCAAIYQNEESRLKSDLKAIAGELNTSYGHLLQAMTLQTSLQAHYFNMIGSGVSSQEFNAFAKIHLANSPWVQALEWVPRVKAEQVKAFETKISQEGRKSFMIRELGTDNVLIPAARREDYFPVTYIWPYQVNAKAYGFDVASEPQHKAALLRARDRAEPAVTAPIRLAQSLVPGEKGLFVAQPVYRKALPLLTPEQRRAALEGYVLIVFYPKALLTYARSLLHSADVEIYLFDVTDGRYAANAQLMAFLPATTGPQPAASLIAADVLKRSGYAEEAAFEFAGRQRLLMIRPSAGFIADYHDGNAIGALGFCWLLAGGLLYYGNYRESQKRVLREAQRARQAEERFRAQLFDYLPLGVELIDQRGLIIDVNPAYAAIVGRSPEQLREMNAGQLTVQEHAMLNDEQLAEVRQTGALNPYEKEIIRPNGERVPVRVMAVRVRRDQEDLILSVAENISERLKTEYQLAQAQKMDAIGQLTGGLAHDFNNMLGVIIGNLDLILLDFSGDHSVMDKLETARTAALRGADLIRGLAAVARKQALNPEVIDINSHLTELMPLIRHTMGQAIEVRSELALSALVCVDAGALASTVLNLAINARDAMPAGGLLTLTTTCRRDASVDADTAITANAYVELTISDTGCGMDAETKAHATDPFFTTKSRGHGTGLGLAMAAGFAHQSGGDLIIDSTVGVGTSVKLILPVGEPAHNEGEALGHLAIGSGRVLIVDDEVELLAVFAVWLKEAGYQVTPCTNADGALSALTEAQAANQPFDIMISDVMMPGMGGVELAYAAHELQPNLALLFVSGYAGNAAYDHVRQLGALLEKPFRQDALCREVRQILNSKLTEQI
jgi:PAS domain S-box-containing protein